MQSDPSNQSPLLELRDVCKTFRSGSLFGKSREVIASESVSFAIHRGEVIALVGESGSGKSTIANLLLRLEKPDSGEILLNGVDMLKKEPGRASLAFRRRVQMVFQDPFGSLNPVHDIAHHIARPLLRHKRAEQSEVHARSIELLRTVGLEPAEEFIHRHPYELSGGQRQRVAIARALAPEPDLLIADEPTSMLDVSIRMGVLNLLDDLKRDRGLAILMITHDLASARFLADRILVLFRGRIVEDGPAESIVSNPAHPYTKALLSSIARADVDPEKGLDVNPGAEDVVVTAGCPFAPRCPDVRDACRTIDPNPRRHEGHRVRCHLYGNPSSGEAA
ncbi:MAG: ABC transporter ATP-binding protein [Gemmatimonadetes bacterium]|nr:ABC transporter ATP-binding protein [Gemmatimonadota bacterium]